MCHSRSSRYHQLLSSIHRRSSWSDKNGMMSLHLIYIMIISKYRRERSSHSVPCIFCHRFCIWVGLLKRLCAWKESWFQFLSVNNLPWKLAHFSLVKYWAGTARIYSHVAISEWSRTNYAFHLKHEQCKLRKKWLKHLMKKEEEKMSTIEWEFNTDMKTTTNLNNEE